MLNEDQRIEAFLNKKPYDRDEFRAEIKKYQDTIANIRKSTPFELRMSMFLVECQSLNESLVTICEDNVQKICKKINDYVFTEMAGQVNLEVRAMLTKFTEKADNSRVLVDFEGQLNDYKDNKRHEMTNSYYDLIEWMIMLYENYQYTVIDDMYKFIEIAYRQTNKVSI